ncbi:MAG: dephospho-CoA kinase [Verrucomicrobiales bacterium]|nr:dephospho-CoA kinase [Verrucomicrobiales bacterium]
MITMAITGGVATGKSAVVAQLTQIWGEHAASFSADAAVHELLTRPDIKTKIGEVFGSSVFDEAGAIDRSQLRQVVFRTPPLRRDLEAILHPEVFVAGQQAHLLAKKSDRSLFVYEIPLLYEVDSKHQRDLDLVVASSEDVQRSRMAERRGLDPETIENLLRSQMPLSVKLERADVVIWNDGTETELEEQVHVLSSLIHHRLESLPR